MSTVNVKQIVMQFLRNEEGASGIEYALVAAMVAVALVAFVPGINTAIKGIFQQIQDAISTSTETTP
ncbi:Flp family type IVb pilin [Methylophaga sp. OBS4]|uniref:Flp family type IVb pilin n=1 Tax=Methylophaga sp. OBS4 TaxID=2991935 RepID=UPI00224CA36C|nr:Flp family type IVb pilin [Methylophaga sp. OBS4]MCX4187517.1 Flp family type IVb pilin [Methylophaga sp. OBS4]